MSAFSAFIALVVINLSNAASDRSDRISGDLISSEGGWGVWSGWVYCEEGQWANTFNFKSESDQGWADDTAGNGVRLICERPGSSTEYAYETGSQKQWGSWSGTNPDSCPVGTWLRGFKARVEGSQGGSDDTALNCIEMECSDGTKLTPKNCRPWGSYGVYAYCSSGYICGLEEKFENDANRVDETGLNAVRFRCCAFTAAPTPAPTNNPTPAPTGNPIPAPTDYPTDSPTDSPTDNPTPSPVIRTSDPTPAPSLSPTTAPTDATPAPTDQGQGFTVNQNTTDWTPLYVALAIVLGLIYCCCVIGGFFAYLWYKQKKGTEDVNAQSVPPISPISEDIEVARAIANEGGDNTTHATKVEGYYETKMDNQENLLPDDVDNIHMHDVNADKDESDDLPSESDDNENAKLYEVKKKKQSAGGYED